MTDTPHNYWIAAGARNIAETTASAGKCRFLRRVPRAIDNLHLLACAVIVALVVLYEVT